MSTPRPAPTFSGSLARQQGFAKTSEEVLKFAVLEHSKVITEIADTNQAIANERKELEQLEGLAASDSILHLAHPRAVAVNHSGPNLNRS